MSLGIVIATADAAKRHDTAIRHLIGFVGGEIVAENRMYLSKAQKEELVRLGVPSEIMIASVGVFAFRGKELHRIEESSIEGIQVNVQLNARDQIRIVFNEFSELFGE